MIRRPGRRSGLQANGGLRGKRRRLQPGEVGAGIFGFEGNGGEGRRALVFALGFGSPVDDMAVGVEDRNEVWSATDGVGVGHTRWARMELEPADNLTGGVVLN